MSGCLAVYNFWIFNKRYDSSENTDMGLSATRQLKLRSAQAMKSDE
ncbi:MAG: hypothetical protein ACJ8KU_10790 [Chthoniobacterales bacterium]